MSRTYQHRYEIKHNPSMAGPFCSRKCKVESERIFPDRRIALAVWESERRGRGICIECGEKHTRATYRCIKCTQKSAKRSGHTHTKLRCSVCGEIGHTKPTHPISPVSR